MVSDFPSPMKYTTPFSYGNPITDPINFNAEGRLQQKTGVRKTAEKSVGKGSVHVRRLCKCEKNYIYSMHTYI